MVQQMEWRVTDEEADAAEEDSSQEVKTKEIDISKLVLCLKHKPWSSVPLPTQCAKQQKVFYRQSCNQETQRARRFPAVPVWCPDTTAESTLSCWCWCVIVRPVLLFSSSANFNIIIVPDTIIDTTMSDSQNSDFSESSGASEHHDDKSIWLFISSFFSMVTSI